MPPTMEIDVSPSESDIRQALTNVIDPELRRDVVELGMDREARMEGSRAIVGIALTTPGCPLKSNIESQVRRAVGALDGVDEVEVRFGVMTQDEREKLRTHLRGGSEKTDGALQLPEGCRIIAVSSGKGGVGKSTVAVNLAAALAAGGAEVGILDADVYGYSVPHMLGIHQKPVTLDGMIVPPVRHNLRIMSIGFFLDDDEPIMWRGPMLHRALEQFLGDVHWGEIEYLVVDMPPGTGDVAISLAQLLPASEVVLVTTPQPAAQSVAARAGQMSQRFDQRLLGIVENMSDPVGGPEIFGRGGAAELAERFDVDVLAQVPLAAELRAGSDAGTPLVLADVPGEAGTELAQLAARVRDLAAPPTPADTQKAADPASRIRKPLEMV